jgi:hypothetical protein
MKIGLCANNIAKSAVNFMPVARNDRAAFLANRGKVVYYMVNHSAHGIGGGQWTTSSDALKAACYGTAEPGIC